MLRTFTKQQIATRKVELVELPDVIAVKQKALNDYLEQLVALQAERDRRDHDHIAPLKAKIRAAEARIEAIDLPPQVELLRTKIATEENILRTLDHDKNYLTIKIDPKESLIANLKLAEIVIKAKLVLAENEAVMKLEGFLMNRYESQLADNVSELDALAKQPVNEALTIEIKEINQNIAALRTQHSEAVARMMKAESSVVQSKKIIAEHSQNLLVLPYVTMTTLPEIQMRIANMANELKPLLVARDELNKTIADHQVALARLTSEKQGIEQSIAHASRDQTRYQHLNKGQVTDELSRLRLEIEPYLTDQAQTLSAIRRLQVTYHNRQHEIIDKQALLEDHVNNHFLIAYEANPASLVMTLKESLLVALQTFANTHHKIDCKETRRCLAEYLTRVEFLAGDQAVLAQETLLQQRERLERLTGYVWSLCSRQYTDVSIKAALEDSFNLSALAEAETLPVYRAYANQFPAQLGPYTDAELANKEDGEYHAARALVLNVLADVPPQHSVQRLHAACQHLVNAINGVDDNKAYKTKLLLAIHAVLIDYANPDNHRKLAELSKLNKHGESSLVKIVSGGVMMVLGAAGGLFSALDETSSSILKPVAFACLITLSGGMLLLSGLTKGLKRCLQSFEAAAQQVQHDPALQNYGVFRAPSSPNIVYGAGEAPTAPQLN